ncbi:MAG TPA: hypothetical protein VEQ59_14490 [Polyangiaceae bacterium]|nr:hypothetical protein [Polyangiaceae bacterium]
MTDDREKASSASESRARPTARDVPFTRSAGSESEPAPRGQRPNQLPRDPTYEAELAKVELAVLRDRDRRSDPSTKQGGRAQRIVGQPPESVTPESPGTRAAQSTLPAPPSGDPPSSSGRLVASGTLLSVGAVDPRGRTEPTLETPRMFFSQPEGREAYFKPGKIPAVTVHQTLETETVKLSDSVDPRRAKTLPRIDRAALARFSDAANASDSESPVAVSNPATSSEAASSAPPGWRSVDYEAASSLGEGDGQIHASLSPFREQAEPSYGFDDIPTRPEPLAARREVEVEVESSSAPAPETSAMPTHRDLPMHRIEASRPPPAPAPPDSLPRPPAVSAIPASEGPSPTTASIAAPDAPQSPAWTNYAAFLLALLLAVVVGMWLTRSCESQGTMPNAVPPSPPADAERTRDPILVPAPPARLQAPELSPKSPQPAAPPRTELETRRSLPPALPAPQQVQVSPESAPPPQAPRKSPPTKPLRETIF